MKQVTEDEILKEYVKRFGGNGKPLDRSRDKNFLKQVEVLNDRESRFKAINCTRRAGKSYTEAIDHFEICEKYPNSRNLYMGITLDSVTEIIWDIFKDLNKKGGYGCKFNETKHICFFPNGSRIRLFGLDVSKKQMRKILGQSLRKVSIDEAGSLTQDMKTLCYQMIMPALTDNAPDSWLTLLGTCENIPGTFFEEVIEGREKGRAWKVHKWTAYENPHMKKQWTAEMKEMQEHNPNIIHASWFKTHYLNEWCADDDLLIIPAKKLVRTKFVNDGSYNFVLAVDLGYNDANSFTIVAFSEKHRRAVIVKSFKEAELDFTDVANQIKKIQREYNIFKIRIDGANKQGVEEIKKRHHIPMEAAEKTDKAIYLRLMRDDVLTGNLVMNEDDCGELYTEWTQLMWKDSDRAKEDDRCQNHCSDSALYAWRECRHYLYAPPEPPEDENTDEFMDKLEEKEAEKMEQMEEDSFLGIGEDW